MTFVNFRSLGAAEIDRMEQYNESAVQVLKNASGDTTGGVWFRADAFPGCVDNAPRERPSGGGQIIRL